MIKKKKETKKRYFVDKHRATKDDIDDIRANIYLRWWIQYLLIYPFIVIWFYDKLIIESSVTLIVLLSFLLMIIEVIIWHYVTTEPYYEAIEK